MPPSFFLWRDLKRFAGPTLCSAPNFGLWPTGKPSWRDEPVVNEPIQSSVLRAGATAPAGATADGDAFVRAEARLRTRRRLRNARLRQIASSLGAEEPERVEQELREYLLKYPQDGEALWLLAQVILRANRLREAVPVLARCLELAPDLVLARFNYAKLLFHFNQFQAALDEVERLLAVDPANAKILELKANLLDFTGRGEESLPIWEQLAKENPDRPPSWVAYGNALHAGGKQAESIAAYRKAIACRPSCGEAYWGLANLKSFRFSDGDIATMEGLLKSPDLSPDDRIDVLFALGRAYELNGAYERSWDYYARGNAAARVRVDFAHTASARVAADKALFTQEFLESRRGAGCKAPDPIFIVGRFRSGSTLLEQILCSHSAIEATGELTHIRAISKRLEEVDAPARGTGYPGILAELQPSALAALGEEYLERARIHRKLGRPFFIDKNPANCFQLGLILLILPNAKIIDARRHPAACCLSMFKQNFKLTNLRLSELGQVYRDYVELMAHFDRILPGRIHRVTYEELVGDPEAEIRKVLDYLGLPFEESCLRFHETKRTVHTPSAEQVRRPISSEGIDYWRNYEPWLGPLLESLGPVLTCYPDVPPELQ